MNQQEIEKQFAGRNLKTLKIFVYYKHLPSGRLDDMNLWEWYRVQKDPQRKLQFEFIKLLDLEDRNKVEPKSSVEEVPVQEDPLQCPLCEFVAKNENGLRLHKRKHK